ncbi:MAG: AraC family transcriptional regulator ligand-binding domain-containing protein [Thermoleophilia bacterium]
MGVVASAVVRRIVEVASGPDSAGELLASVGLPAGADAAVAMRQVIDADAYYGLIERAAREDDDALPFRYAAALRADDFAALGLAMKTARTVGESLQRLARYILVLTDTLEYEFVADAQGRAFVLRGRPNGRRGARLANECALAAVVSVMRQVAVAPTGPELVTFRHAAPATTSPHRAFFGCPVLFGTSADALRLGVDALATPARLADEGLSSFVLGHLDEMRDRQAGRSVAARVHGAVVDALPDGPPPASQVARRLGMSARTLQRRLADDGDTFQALADRARRDAAEALLAGGDHSLAEVAFLTGFSDQSAFQRAFKRWTGSTPAAFREARVA